MPNRLLDWQIRVKSTLREYHAAQIALDLLEQAEPDEIHRLTEDRGWDALAAVERNAAGHHIQGTYIIRMYSVFEGAVVSYWKLLQSDESRRADGDVMIEEIGDHRKIHPSVTEGAQLVRRHRNNLVHRNFSGSATGMKIEDVHADLNNFLSRLPGRW
ncbi:MAG: hypothetical protein BGO49_08050 [Planctomycetales bacterium 71-10]|nr:MAG: hypothetical protein BGO49_08050 [Planctomycetales bacterium 71-10]